MFPTLERNKENLKEYCIRIFGALNDADPKAKAEHLVESGFWHIRTSIGTSDATHLDRQGLLNVGICPECGDKIGTESSWPYSWTWNNGPKLLICKNCYDEGMAKQQERLKNGKGGCYIATVCYKSEFHENVLYLKWYRDEILQQSSFGRSFIKTYYAYSPRIADYLSERFVLNKIVRLGLTFSIKILKRFFN